jgi:hypothetical protein
MSIYKEEKKEEKSVDRITISDIFLDIYKNFNVYEQTTKMKQLNKSELYLLLILTLDNLDETEPVSLNNYRDFKEEILEICDIQNDKTTNNETLLELVKITNDKYIDVTILVDKNGLELPEPLNREEVRDAKINIINNID